MLTLHDSWGLFRLRFLNRNVWVNAKYAQDCCQPAMETHVHVAGPIYKESLLVPPQSRLPGQHHLLLMTWRRNAVLQRKQFRRGRSGFGRNVFFRLFAQWWLTTTHNHGRSCTRFRSVFCVASSVAALQETEEKPKRRGFAEVGYKGNG